MPGDTKIITNSSSLNKGNHDRYSSRISDIIISINFYDFISPFFSLILVSIENTYQTLKTGECLTTFPNTSKFVKNTPLRVLFSTLFSVFGNVVKHGLSCLINYAKAMPQNGFIDNVIIKLIGVLTINGNVIIIKF